MYPIEKSFFISDLHLNHLWINKKGELRSIIFFERTQFKTIQEHDKYVIDSLKSWAKKHKNYNLFILGDLGGINEFISLANILRYNYGIYLIVVKGNHEKLCDEPKIESCVDEYHKYPYYISKRVMVSHEPQYPAPTGVVNICGHLHREDINDPQFICVSEHLVNYQPISWKSVENRLSKIPAPSYKFLREPYRDKLILTQPNDDAIAICGKQTGLIDIPASLKIYNKNHGTNLK